MIGCEKLMKKYSNFARYINETMHVLLIKQHYIEHQNILTAIDNQD